MAAVYEKLNEDDDAIDLSSDQIPLKTVFEDSEHEVTASIQVYGPECGEDCECFQLSSLEHPMPPVSQLSWLDRYLTIWILLTMGFGLLIGYFVPTIGEVFQTVTVADVSVPVAVGLFAMMYPVLCKVQYERMGEIMCERALWFQLVFSVMLNWIVGPFLMTGLAWLTLFDLPAYRTGVILVGLARCIAMVLLWNSLAGGSSDYCAILVAVNSILQLVLYSPLAILFLDTLPAAVGANTSNVQVSFVQVAQGVTIFLGVPLVLGIFTRFALRAWRGKIWFESVFVRYVSPLALLGLLYTIFILFANQGHAILSDLAPVARVSVPLFAYFGIMFSGTLGLARLFKFPYEYAISQALTASSNNFELAIAVAIAIFGVSSPQALAAVVGPLIEVPVLLVLVHIALWLKPYW